MLNYLLKTAKAIFNGIAEARQRQAAYEVARILKLNNDFKSWSHYELMEAIMDKKNPVGIDKKPIAKKLA
jgi:hypothetical protein